MRFLALLVSALGAAGCFDVHGVDLGPLVIDDFDDGDFVPAHPHFPLSWQCFAFNPDKKVGFTCDHDAGDNSPYSLYLEATIDDPPDGVQQFGGAALITFARPPEDFSRFRELVFSARLESENPPLPSSAQLGVELGCSTAPTEDGSHPGYLRVTQSTDYMRTWQTNTLALANFNSPSFEAIHIAGGPIACLERVDQIEFAVNAALPDGQSGKFLLHIDSIFFR